MPGAGAAVLGKRPRLGGAHLARLRRFRFRPVKAGGMICALVSRSLGPGGQSRVRARRSERVGNGEPGPACSPIQGKPSPAAGGESAFIRTLTASVPESAGGGSAAESELWRRKSLVNSIVTCNPDREK